MIADEDLNSLADESPFILGGEAQAGHSSNTVVVLADNVIRVPAGWTGLTGKRVTVRLTEPVKPGRYIFFADPSSVGDELVVQERAHLEAGSRTTDERVAAAVREGYQRLIVRRAEAATLVALGTLGDVRSLIEGKGRPRGVPWAEAPLEVERTLKGPEKVNRATVVGPRYATRRLPRRPALHPHLHAIFFLTSPPKEATELLAHAHRESAFFLDSAADIQPPDRLALIEQALRGGKRKK